MVACGTPLARKGSNCHCRTQAIAAASNSGIDLRISRCATSPSSPMRSSTTTVPSTLALKGAWGYCGRVIRIAFGGVSSGLVAVLASDGDRRCPRAQAAAYRTDRSASVRSGSSAARASGWSSLAPASCQAAAARRLTSAEERAAISRCVGLLGGGTGTSIALRGRAAATSASDARARASLVFRTCHPPWFGCLHPAASLASILTSDAGVANTRPAL